MSAELSSPTNPDIDVCQTCGYRTFSSEAGDAGVFESEDCFPFLFIFHSKRAFQVWASAGGGVILLGLTIQTDPT